jgi:hypothetical protein
MKCEDIQKMMMLMKNMPIMQECAPVSTTLISQDRLRSVTQAMHPCEPKARPGIVSWLGLAAAWRQILIQHASPLFFFLRREA